MDAPKLMMIGVAGLGAYAAYRMLGAKKDAAQEETIIDSSGLVLLKDPLSMKQKQYYRARLELPASRLQPLPPFNEEGTDDDLTQAMSALGFSDVQVFSSKEHLPSGWPVGTTGGPTRGTRWFQGRWSQEAMQVPRPSQVKIMWISKAPGV